MKSVMLLVFVLLVLTVVRAEMNHMISEELARAFMITPKEAELCVRKVSATENDFLLLRMAIAEKQEIDDKNSLRRASCAAVCCAQAQGTMIGAEIQLPMINKLIKESEMPLMYKHQFFVIVNECHEQAKKITNECEVGLEFVRCVVYKNFVMGY